MLGQGISVWARCGFVMAATVFASAVSHAVEASFEREVRPVLLELCLDCHGPEKQKGGLRVDELRAELDGDAGGEIWHDILDQLVLGEMPPAKAPQPSASQRRLLVEWTGEWLREAAEAKRYARGRVVTRRLTRYEYANTLRDLLDVRLDFARDLPPEPVSPEGFLNNAATLEMAPELVRSYLDVARDALAEVIVSGDPPEIHRYEAKKTAIGKLPNTKVKKHEPVNPEFVLDVDPFPRRGEFEVRVRARAALPGGTALPRIRVSMGHVPGIIHVPRVVIGEVDVRSEPETFTFRGRMEDFPQPGHLRHRQADFQGMIVMVDFLDADGNELRYPDRTYARIPDKKKGKKKGEKAEAPEPERVPVPFGERLEIEVESVSFEAPVLASWPPPAHQRFVSGRGPEDIHAILEHFMTRAFRRPPGREEIEETAALFQALLAANDSFEEALRETFAAVLVSPHFLYRVERRTRDEGVEPVSDFELATRLSYFLWSTMPDETLFELAERGRLGQPEVLAGEVARMLDDPRSARFAAHFVDQWMDLDGLRRVAVNPEAFPDFDEGLKDDFRRETLACFERVLLENRSALELLDARWAMWNRDLAAHYGRDEEVRSSELEVVALPAGDPRGGLLGQGAFLLANSTGAESHPIKRAVWILDRLLDSPPAPPPPDVPELDPERPDLVGLSVKEQMAVHREKASCRDCHEGIDPWGLALERFDAVGRWDAGAAEEAAILPNGRSIHGFAELKAYLVEERSERFARALVRRLLSYALGRSLDLGDRMAVESLTEGFVASEYRLQQLTVDLVQSEAFRTK